MYAIACMTHSTAGARSHEMEASYPGIIDDVQYSHHNTMHVCDGSGRLVMPIE